MQVNRKTNNGRPVRRSSANTALPHVYAIIAQVAAIVTPTLEAKQRGFQTDPLDSVGCSFCGAPREVYQIITRGDALCTFFFRWGEVYCH